MDKHIFSHAYKYILKASLKTTAKKSKLNLSHIVYILDSAYESVVKATDSKTSYIEAFQLVVVPV